jgi:hypothetical protein
MAQSDVDNGDLTVVTGLAPVTPPDFVIIAIAAFAGLRALDIRPLPRDPPWRWRPRVGEA